MKIALVNSTFLPKIGGMGQVVYEEARRLSARGHAVTVFTLRFPGVDESADATSPFKIVRLSAWRFGDAGIAPQLLFKLRNFHLVHLHYPFYGSAHFVYFAKILFGQKYLLTYHMDARPAGFLKKFLQKIYDWMWARLVIKNSVGVITVDKSHLLVSDYVKSVSENNIKEIFNGVDTEIFSPMALGANEVFLPEFSGKKIILFVGNPLPFKRLDFLLRAMSVVVTADALLLVNSAGYEIEKYKKLATELGLDHKVKFIGRQKTQLDLAKLFCLAQCLVVASTGSAESFSLVSVEAQACGCPVIIADDGSVRRRVENNWDGYWFDANSVSDLARKIDQMLNLTPTEKKLFNDRASKKVLQNYSWDKHTAELEDYYRSLC